MPLVRISLRKGKAPRYRRRLGEIIYETMAEVMNVPPRDNFQITTEHDPLGLVYDPEYLGIHRTDDIVMVQITLNEGRTVDVKKHFYKHLADRLHKDLGLRREDLFVGLVEVRKENWSFGNGEAQYAP
jgi:phenylpyruvate tautomerase PptA (4-oxalocrotonate tautomerase family)